MVCLKTRPARKCVDQNLPTHGGKHLAETWRCRCAAALAPPAESETERQRLYVLPLHARGVRPDGAFLAHGLCLLEGPGLVGTGDTLLHTPRERALIHESLSPVHGVDARPERRQGNRQVEGVQIGNSRSTLSSSGSPGRRTSQKMNFGIGRSAANTPFPNLITES